MPVKEFLRISLYFAKIGQWQSGTFFWDTVYLCRVNYGFHLFPFFFFSSAACSYLSCVMYTTPRLYSYIQTYVSYGIRDNNIENKRAQKNKKNWCERFPVQKWPVLKNRRLRSADCQKPQKWTHLAQWRLMRWPNSLSTPETPRHMDGRPRNVMLTSVFVKSLSGIPEDTCMYDHSTTLRFVYPTARMPYA